MHTIVIAAVLFTVCAVVDQQIIWGITLAEIVLDKLSAEIPNNNTEQ